MKRQYVYPSEVKFAGAGAIALAVYFSSATIGGFYAAYVGQTGIFRVIDLCLYLIATMLFVQVFIRHFRKLCVSVVGLVFVAAIAIFLELQGYGVGSSDFGTQVLPLRPSQFILALAHVVLGLILVKDTRVPKILGLSMFFLALTWVPQWIFNGQVAKQIYFGFLTDVAFLVAYGCLGIWLFIYWHAERRSETRQEEAAEPKLLGARQPFLAQLLHLR